MVTTRSGAGGKIVTNRRKQRLAVTPYDRPPPPPPIKSPNWFTALIVPSARAIASGAGKILSSIFSESESSEDEDSASEDGVDNDIEYEIPRDGVAASTEVGEETPLSVRRMETKRIIEQLIMQETFSRDECDRLVKVLDSRVIDWSLEAGENSNHENVDIYNKAVVEAKDWFQEKKFGSSSATELAHQSLNLKSKGPQHVGTEGGSPVDVARSYMKERPAWASPMKNVELRTPLTSTRNFFNEGTSYSVGHDSLSAVKKQSPFSSGSWNIQEELRRVREKATEDMLCTPSTRFDSSWFSFAPSGKESVGAGKVVMEERTTEPESPGKAKPVEVLVDAGISSDPVLAALESRQDSKPSLPHPATSVSGNNKDSEAVQMEGEYGTPEFPQHYSPKNGREHHTDGGKQSVNGHSSSQASLSAGEATAQEDEQHDVENHIAETITENKVAITNIEGERVLLSEAAIEVAIVSETDSIASVSQSSLGMPPEELSLDKGKQRGRPVRNTRRGRGRGK